MELIRWIAGVVLSAAFLAAFVLLAWYVVLPLLLIFLIAGAVASLRAPKHAPRRHARERRVEDASVIDADYTEIS